MYIDFLTDEDWKVLSAMQQVPCGDAQALTWFYDLVCFVGREGWAEEIET